MPTGFNGGRGGSTRRGRDGHRDRPLAEHLLVDAERGTTRRERRRARRLGPLLADDAGREFLFALTDQVLRTPDAGAGDAAAPRPRRPPDSPTALPRLDRAGLRLAATRLHGRRPVPSPPSPAGGSAPRPAA